MKKKLVRSITYDCEIMKMSYWTAGAERNVLTWTNMKKGTTERFGIPTMSKVVKFVGSDCSVAVARGHCWNEIM